MKVSYFAKVIDNSNKTRFKFPFGTLLDKINDEWVIIIEYYENYYPFAIGENDGNYREITREEFSTNKFIKLFNTCYINRRIKKLCDDCNRICVDGYPVCKNGHKLYFCGQNGNIIYKLPGFHYIEDTINIYVHQDKLELSIYYGNAPLLAISDLLFD